MIAMTATTTISSIMLKARAPRWLGWMFKQCLRWVFLIGSCLVPSRDASRQNNRSIPSNRNADEIGRRLPPSRLRASNLRKGFSREA